ncbi:MAG: hypothetical protein PF689_11165, partial [Deltaproteobacteria bacterium]|nr:hypothetical protein [Deltaproteobacteria bacterium]
MSVIKRAIISVQDYDSIKELVEFLNQYDIEVLATGDNQDYLKIAKCKTTDVTDTGFAPVLVENLQQKTTGFQNQDLELVIVNLKKLKSGKKGKSFSNLDFEIESLIRFAARNFHSIVIVTDTGDYQMLKDMIKKDEIPVSIRQIWAQKAFFQLSSHDANVASYIGGLMANQIYDGRIPVNFHRQLKESSSHEVVNLRDTSSWEAQGKSNRKTEVYSANPEFPQNNEDLYSRKTTVMEGQGSESPREIETEAYEASIEEDSVPDTESVGETEPKQEKTDSNEKKELKNKSDEATLGNEIDSLVNVNLRETRKLEAQKDDSFSGEEEPDISSEAEASLEEMEQKDETDFEPKAAAPVDLDFTPISSRRNRNFSIVVIILVGVALLSYLFYKNYQEEEIDFKPGKSATADNKQQAGTMNKPENSQKTKDQKTKEKEKRNIAQKNARIRAQKVAAAKQQKEKLHNELKKSESEDKEKSKPTDNALIKVAVKDKKHHNPVEAGCKICIKKAMQAMGRSKYKKATKLLKTSLNITPEDASTKALLSLVYHALGQDSLALKQAEEALKINPRTRWALLVAGTTRQL